MLTYMPIKLNTNGKREYLPYKMDDDGRYTSVQDFIHDAKISLDMQFTCLGKSYSLCGCNNDFWSICESDMIETEASYPTLEDLLKNHIFAGRHFEEIICEIEVFEATGVCKDSETRWVNIPKEYMPKE